MKPNLQVQLCALAAVLGLSACEPTAPALPNDLAIRLAPARAFYPVGDTARAILTGTGLGGQQWRSLDTKVALVSLTGLISMVGEGVGTVEGKLDRRTVRIEFVVDGILRNRDIDFHETWSAAESPHVVDRPLVVQGPGGVVLTIEPGATVLFRPGSHLAIGDLYRGRLVIPSGTQPVVMAGDSAVRGSWGGLRFRGSGASELRNLTMRHCGASPPGGSAAGCIVASYYPTSFQSPSLLVDEVTVTEAVNYGLDFDNWVTFAPGSRNLTITDVDGYIAMMSPVAAGHFPTGGRLEGNTHNEIRIHTGRVHESTTWHNLGVSWRLSGSVIVEGDPGVEAVLTIPSGHIRADNGSAITVGKFGGGRLVAGSAMGPQLVFEPAGDHHWMGIEISDGAGPSSLSNVLLRRCGDSGGCVKVFGGGGEGTRLFVDRTIIRDAHGSGIRMTAQARFAEGSNDLTITGTTGVPLYLPPDAVGSIPPGNYRGNTWNAVRIFGAELSRSATWRNPGVPIYAPSGLNLNNPFSKIVLTLERGVVLQIGTEKFIMAGGWPSALRVTGTAAEPVRITSLTPTVPGSWGGISLGELTEPETHFEHLIVEAAGEGPTGIGAGIRLYKDPGGLLRNTTVRNSAGCGLVLFGNRDWTEDYTNPVFGNVFLNNAGPSRCRY